MTITLDTKLRNEDLFNSLDSENEESVKRFEKKKNPISNSHLVKDFEKILYTARHNTINTSNSYYDVIKNISAIENDQISAKELEQFTLVLPEYQDIEDFDILSGTYLSYLVNISKDNEFRIFTSSLENLPISLGQFNEGKLINVIGDIGENLGDFMNGGEILVEGDAGSNIGLGMVKGIVRINGISGFDIGRVMQGGEIYLNGDYRSLSENIGGGNIYHKRKQIVKDGRILI